VLKYVEIDFEYSNPSNPILDVVCCSLRVQGGEIEEFWLLGDKTPFIARINELKDYTFIAHNVVAEARSFLSLGLKPLDFKWICTFAEWRCITNHNSEMRYGNHLVKGKVKNLIPPRWSKFSDSDSHQKLTHSLAEMVYKLKSIKIDTEHKDMVRDILIAGDLDEVERNRELIMSYCSSDIPHLYHCLNLMFKEQVRLLPRPKAQVLADMYIRSETMVRTAMMEHVGYPIDVDKTRNFTKSVGKILREVQRDINRQFPTMRIFHFDKKSGLYTRKEKPIKKWIDNSNLADRWDTTETGGYSLSLDAFTRHFNYRHSFPEGNLGAQMVRFLKLKQSLNGFQPTRKKGARGFWDSVGSDGRARAHLNPYGSQSGRFQPAATGFIFLKAAWMRSLVVPPKGKCIIGIDYKSQEYLIAALLSGDEKMINAYRSGDVYMSYAIDAGIAPVGATKKTHNKERNLAKPVVLGISYDMTSVGLSQQLSEATGEEVGEHEAQEYIDLFFQSYPKYAEWKEEKKEEYQEIGHVRIPDGWTMWGENPNFRSVGNCPIQGLGAAILRKAIALCQDDGLDVIVPLHDALYIEVPLEGYEESALRFRSHMMAAFDYYLPNSGVLLDGEIWSPELEEREFDGFKVEKIHIDERAINEYQTFSKYFNRPLGDFL
jgi:hypothetical protein